MKKAVRIVRLDRSDELDFDYWLKASPAEKLETLQYLREMVFIKNKKAVGRDRDRLDVKYLERVKKARGK